VYKLLRGCDGDHLINLREGDEFPDYQGLPAEWALYKPSSIDAGRTDQQLSKDQDAYEQWKRVVEQTRDRMAASAKRIEEAKIFLAGLRARNAGGEVSETPQRESTSQ
jgi:hypothetical protein